MRILILNKFAHVTGGADRHALGVARALRERGHEVQFLSTASPRNLEHEGRFVRCSVSHESRDSLPVRTRLEVLHTAIWNREAVRAADRLLDEFQPDIVHAHKLYPQLSCAPVVVARRRGVPVVQTLHDYEFLSADPYSADGRRIDRRESRADYRTLNAVAFLVRRRFHVPAVAEWIAVSDFVAAEYGRAGIRATTILNFADVDVTGAPFETRQGVLFLGTLSREKGVLDILTAAERLPEVPFVIVGSGPLAALVADRAKALPNLCFRGRLNVSEATDAVQRAAVMAVPSRWQEPGALVSLEAMAAGTPIVAYRRGGLGEYVERSGAGVVIEPDGARLGDMCRELVTDRNRWERLSEAGVVATRTIFSRDAHVDALLEVYRRATEGGAVSS